MSSKIKIFTIGADMSSIFILRGAEPNIRRRYLLKLMSSIFAEPNMLSRSRRHLVNVRPFVRCP